MPQKNCWIQTPMTRQPNVFSISLCDVPAKAARGVMEQREGDREQGTVMCFGGHLISETCIICHNWYGRNGICAPKGTISAVVAWWSLGFSKSLAHITVGRTTQKTAKPSPRWMNFRRVWERLSFSKFLMITAVQRGIRNRTQVWSIQ